jgi:putative MATE family efflux protein
LIDLFFISLLGESALAAAVGFAGALMFFTQSLSIGLSIAIGATASKAIGANDDQRAAELVSSGVIFILVSTGIVTLTVWIFRVSLLTWLGAEGETLEFAASYLGIILPWLPLLSIGMAMGGVMRAKGDAKGALWLTLSGAIVNAVFDPLLIFGLGLGLQGAAIASVLSRITMFLYGTHMVFRVYELKALPTWQKLKTDVVNISQIAVPSVLTNLATPVGMAYVTATMAKYGDAAIAGTAIISRLQMVAFVGLYALSSVVGPIAGQNWGGKQYDRVKLVLTESVRFVLIYCLVMSALLALATPVIIASFQASEQSAQLIRLFTYGLSLVYIFNGITFVTNALFNNLGAAKVSTYFNVSKATFFTIPFVWLGAYYGGAVGILLGQALGAAIIALLGWVWCVRWVNRLDQLS